MKTWLWSPDCAVRECSHCCRLLIRHCNVPCPWHGQGRWKVQQVGYRYQEVGRPSAQTMTVVVRGQNRPAYELLEDIAWQAQPLAFVRVDPINRTITLARTSGREKRS